MDFRGRSVVLTGASKGIGARLAERLAERGARLTLAARSAGALEEVAGRCRQLGGEAIVAPTDVADAEACGALVARAVEAWGAIDAVVHNAGISMWARFDEVEDLGVFERIMRVNYLGPVYLTHHALPHLKRSRGLLVAISSLTGKTGVPTRSGYAASKHALQGFCDSLRIELRHTGVDVCVISPGFVDTDIRATALGGDGASLGASPRDERENMSVDECVEIVVEAMEARRREVVMTGLAKAGMALKLISPRAVDWITARKIGDPGK
ncbi:MAG TPA: SDR family oxidoreductase [Polyangiaceae bacterium LLY-WYZ-15_(1-7)]|nr:short chain dehydrogenase [Myxococcales bacterium]MAT28524.1 short chain dehydrogenase [Sandaracinus sp.]HJL01566.1 SDR family oxidoreductase [Polyangiaceae bacterium LLY-WYZ-15_(1-7)]MBJ74837.1 short chain dehydrogenase [Sandaracinus sp.]HJL08606.1 SDR family oxidoreductase [Polyangiaceae bacterium LLY-WYZ-15_(1-7)]